MRDIEATGLHIATAGNLCALHFSSPSGTTVVRLPLHVFVDKARARHDGNGHLFPSPAPQGGAW